MAPISHVNPGEVIRASLINQLIDVANGGAAAPASGVAVPDVFGLQLAQARAILTQLSVNLTLGSVFDVFGTAINPSGVGSGGLLVLGQAPPAQTRVPVGSPVNLTVAGSQSGGGGSGGGPQPVGDLFVKDPTGPAGNINQKNTYIFKFPVTAAVSVEEKYNLKATALGISHPSEWKARAVTGTAPNLQEITEITIPAAPPPNGTTVEVAVELTVPDGTNGTAGSLTLKVTSQRNPSISDDSTAQITVGSAAPTPQAITVQYQSVTNGVKQQDGTVSVGSPKSRITYQAQVPDLGPKAYDVTFDATPAGFTPTVVGGTDTTTGSKVLVFNIDVTKAGTPSPGTLKIRVTDHTDVSKFGTLDQKLA